MAADTYIFRAALAGFRAEPCPPILESRGEAPPQYGYDDEELAEIA